MKAADEPTMLKATLGLALAGLVLFGASLNDPFHFDDALFLNDSNVTNPARWHHFLNPLHLRQLTFFTFYVNHILSGTNAVTYHALNVGLHIANAILFFMLLNKWVDRRIAWIAAAVFLMHPIQTEPVLYIYQRSVLLAAFFSLLGLLALERHRPWLSLLCFFLAFESKESALAVPLLIAIYQFSRGRRVEPGRRSLAAPVVVLAVVLVAVATLALLAYRDEATVGFGVAERVSPLTYFMTQTRVVYTYLRLLFFPVPQSLEYDFSLIRHFGLNVALQLAGVFLIVTVGLMLARLDKWRVTGLAVVGFFILLAPTSSVIPSADAAFEHRLYLPMFAFAVFAASLAARVKKPAMIAVPILLLCCVLTVRRGRVWASQSSLWEDTVLHAPNKARAWFNLGGAYLKSDPDRARVAFTRALSLEPNFPEAYYDLGVIEQDRGNYREAITLYQRTTEMNPEYWPAWNNLGNSFLALGENSRALEAYSRTLNLNPDHWPSQYNIAIVHYTAGRFDKAIPRLRSVLEWSPDFRDARYLLASSLARSGDAAEAEREWKKLGHAPGQPPIPAPISAPTR